MHHVLDQSGNERAADTKRKHIVAGRDRRTATQGHHFKWAVDAGHVKTNPTIDVENPRQKKTGGFPIWNEEEVERYEAHWPLGTNERV
jgi:site-specific recombinase XerC